MFSDTPVRICTAEDVGFIIFKMTFLVKGLPSFHLSLLSPKEDSTN